MRGKVGHVIRWVWLLVLENLKLPSFSHEIGSEIMEVTVEEKQWMSERMCRRERERVG